MERPALKKHACKVLLLEDYLIYKLTGRFATEHSLICFTYLPDGAEQAVYEKLYQDYLRLDAMAAGSGGGRGAAPVCQPRNGQVQRSGHHQHHVSVRDLPRSAGGSH